jgi:hypothetical protein
MSCTLFFGERKQAKMLIEKLQEFLSDFGVKELPKPKDVIAVTLLLAALVLWRRSKRTRNSHLLDDDNGAI